MMRKIALLTALLVVLCCGVAAAQVTVNPGGLGDALIYGYYNVNDNRSNFFTVVNTSSDYGVRARVRFLEASDVNNAAGLCEGSYEMLDFDICLSPNDVWSGVIKKVGNVATLFSADSDTAIDAAPTRVRTNEGTSPDGTFADRWPGGVPFKTGSSTPQNITAGQTLEGYFIVIAENKLEEISAPLAGPYLGNCGGTLRDVPAWGSVDNVLFGNHYMVDLDSFETFAYNATALADFSSRVFLNQPQDANPNLGDADGGLSAVNFALTKSDVFSIYDLESSISGKTAMIITFPTRQLTARAAGGITYSSATGTCTAGNPDIFDDSRVLVTVWDDQENSDQTICEFSPCIGVDVELPYEVNVIRMGNSNIFTSGVEIEITPSSAFDFGFVHIDLTRAATSTVNPAHLTVFGDEVSHGLPLIGYTALSFSGGKTTHLLPLQYSSRIAPN